MKNKYKILDSGNFYLSKYPVLLAQGRSVRGVLGLAQGSIPVYFPVINKGKEFIVEDTIEVSLDKKDTKLIELCLKFKNNADTLYFGMLAEAIWNALKKFNLKEYKNCWFVPIQLYKLGKDYICSVDILRETKGKNRK